MCPAWPPCRQLWHQVNQLLNWASLFSIVKSTFSSDFPVPARQDLSLSLHEQSLKFDYVSTLVWVTTRQLRKLGWPPNCQMQLQLNVDQSPDTVHRKSSVKYYVHSGCSKTPAWTSVYILHTGWFTWTIRNRCAHVHEAEGTTWQRFPAARTTGDFWLSGWAADPVLAEAAALVRHCRAAVGNGLPAEVAAHKHLSQKNKHKGRLISWWTRR